MKAFTANNNSWSGAGCSDWFCMGSHWLRKSVLAIEYFRLILTPLKFIPWRVFGLKMHQCSGQIDPDRYYFMLSMFLCGWVYGVLSRVRIYRSVDNGWVGHGRYLQYHYFILEYYATCNATRFELPVFLWCAFGVEICARKLALLFRILIDTWSSFSQEALDGSAAWTGCDGLWYTVVAPLLLFEETASILKGSSRRRWNDRLCGGWCWMPSAGSAQPALNLFSQLKLTKAAAVHVYAVFHFIFRRPNITRPYFRKLPPMMSEERKGLERRDWFVWSKGALYLAPSCLNVSSTAFKWNSLFSLAFTAPTLAELSIMLEAIPVLAIIIVWLARLGLFFSLAWNYIRSSGEDQLGSDDIRDMLFNQ